MNEGVPDPAKEPHISSAQRLEAYLDDQRVPVWGGGVSGDFINIVVGTSMRCAAEPLWPKIQRIKTVEEYIRDKMIDTGALDASEIAARVTQGVNREFLTKANAIIAEMNFVIGAGVTSQEQADALLAKFQAYSNLLYKREG